ncbi:putative inorganic carbon transporter subunit DabA, partial [Staphylococcus epidermidis]|uniref:putative inorganic carbon transporter subunit DabA n=1 Tax=Staphylococcus epidermidis TaxID=1282 RepID=UPI0011A394AD
FLHNYHSTKHQHPHILNTIISRPPLLPQSINLQYYPSTLPPHYYPTPSKTTQTLTTRLALIQPNPTHLIYPLPSHSLIINHKHPYHPPITLL